MERFRTEQERVDGLTCRIECGALLQNPNVQGSGFIRHPPQRAYRQQQGQYQQQQQQPVSGYKYDYLPPNTRHASHGYQQRGNGRQRYAPRGSLSALQMPNVPPPPPIRMNPHHQQASPIATSFSSVNQMYTSQQASSIGLIDETNSRAMSSMHGRIDPGRRPDGIMDKGPWYSGPLSQASVYQNVGGGYPPTGGNLMVPPPPPLQMMQQGFMHGMHGGEPGQGLQGPLMQQASFMSVPPEHVGTQIYPAANGQVPQVQTLGPGHPVPMPPPPPPPRYLQIPQVPIDDSSRSNQPGESGSRSPTINYQPPPPHKAPAPIGTPLPGSYMQKPTKVAQQNRPVSRSPGQVGQASATKPLPAPQLPRTSPVTNYRQDANALASGLAEKLEIESNGNQSWKDSVSSREIDACESSGQLEKGTLTKRQKTRLRKKMREAHMKAPGAQKKVVL